MTELTPRQQQIYDYIRGYIQENKMPPTVRKIGAKFDIRSPNGVMCHLRAIEKKGLIRRLEKTSRGIQLTETAKCPHCGGLL